MIKVGSARSSYGNTTPGDQNGREVSIQDFYVHKPYWLGFILKDKSKSVPLAKAMTDACKNDFIGYDQATRMTAREAYIKYGSISGIKEKCNTDCSQLVNLCLYSIGVSLPNFNTASMPGVLRQSGLFIEKKVYDYTDCQKGMILVTPTKGHTLIVTSIGEQAPAQPKPEKPVIPSCKPVIKLGSKGQRVQYLQILLGRPTSAKFSQFDVEALKKFQTEHGLEADGEYGPLTQKEMVKIYV